jgi:hypothetical protein
MASKDLLRQGIEPDASAWRLIDHHAGEPHLEKHIE